MMTTAQIASILSHVTYKDWSIHVGGQESSDGRLYLQVRFVADCSVTGRPAEQRCRKWWLSKYMTETELVDTAFKAIQAAELHESAHMFKYQGWDIYNPHVSVSARLELRQRGSRSLEHRTDLDRQVRNHRTERLADLRKRYGFTDAQIVNMSQDGYAFSNAFKAIIREWRGLLE